MSPCPAPLSSNKVLWADLGLGLGLPGISILGQSLDSSDPQLSLFQIRGWETEKKDPLVLSFLLGTAVGEAENAALVRHGEKIEIFGQRSDWTSTEALPATLMPYHSYLT